LEPVKVNEQLPYVLQLEGLKKTTGARYENVFGEMTELCSEMFIEMTRFLPTPGATLHGTYPGIVPVIGQIVEPMETVCNEGNPKFDPTNITVSSPLAPNAGK